jgi:hypothetical protein
MPQKESKLVGVFNSRLGERYIDLSQVIAWILGDSTGKLVITLRGVYSQNDQGQGNCNYYFFRDKDMGFDALVERLRAISEKLWEE